MVILGPNMQDEQRRWLDWAVTAFNESISEYERYEAYYVGDHELEYATDRWKDTFGTEFEEFADNWCGVVVDAVASRLVITGWDTDDDTGDEIKRAAQDIWDRNELTAEELDLYTGTVSKGDGYLLVWPSDEDPKGNTPDVVYHDATAMNVLYDPENDRKIARGAKHWWDLDGQRHLNIYYPDRIEPYIIPDETTGAMLAGFQVPEWNGSLPPGWQRDGDVIENPFGRVPIFHFRNKRHNSTHGLSEIKVVIPIQNAVNKLLMDLMVGSEFGSFRQKWMTGSGHPPEGWKAGTGRVWATTDPNANFGEFGQIDLEPMVKAIESLVGHIAKITATPMHYLRPSGDMPSGEALKTAEAGLIKKVEQRSKTFGAAWSQAMTFALIINGKTPKKPVTPIWDSFEIRHDLEQAQTAQLKAILGIPIEVLWKEHFGATDEQVREWKDINADIVASILKAVVAQTGQIAPGADDAALPEGTSVAQILAAVGKGVTAETAAGEGTVNPQGNTTPPASPTRRSRGFRD